MAAQCVTGDQPKGGGNRCPRQPGETFLFTRCVSVYFGHMPKLDKTKPKIGRPPSEAKFAAIQLKIPPALLATLDRYAATNFEDSRASVIRKFIVQGLKRAGMKP